MCHFSLKDAYIGAIMSKCEMIVFCDRVKMALACGLEILYSDKTTTKSENNYFPHILFL